ncbi:hypothetical protein ACS0TY_021732 [Phlomoides rotata]
MGLECPRSIEKIGTKVKKWKEHDKVCAILSGEGYAEKVAAQEETPLNRLPDDKNARLFTSKTLLC